MARAVGITLIDGIGPVLDLRAATVASQVMEAMESGKDQIEAYARQNAPWSDITGDARQGLTASVYLEGGVVVLELAHSVDYGYWLEVIQDGEFAIIMPTLETLGPEIIRDAGGAVMFSGSTF